MDHGPRTFRDQFLSIYQSMAADVARQSAEITELSGALEGIDEKRDEIVAAEIAAARFATALQQGGGIENKPDETATLEEMSVPENARVCAALALRLMWANLKGDAATVAYIENEELPGSKCDAKWAATVKEYVKYFGLSGRGGTIPYIAATDKTPQIITIKSNARIGLIGDWGTGAAPARRVLRQLEEKKPDILIHLGDIYYSGTETECQINFESIVNDILDRKNNDIPVFALAGNHDMYSGGAGYYGLIKRLNRPPLMQQASFFCLRSADNAWQLLAMDTGRFDFNPITVTHALTKVDATELDWHAERVAEFPGKTILLSHHQLFSAYSPIGQTAPDGSLPAYNAELKKVLDRLQHGGREIAAWFWGHEHNLSIYRPYLNLRRGRCLGHSAIPVFAQDEPYQTVAGIEDLPQTVDATKLSMADGVYSHGFAMLALGPKAATADYFEDRGGTAVKMYSETID